MNLKTILKQRYDIAVDGEISTLAANLHVFKCRNRKLLLKRHNSLTIADLEQVDHTYGIVRQETFMPEMLPTRSGAFLCRSDDEIYSLQQYMDGQAVDAGDMATLAPRLAELHRSLAQYDGNQFKNHFERVVTDIQAAARHYGYGENSDTLSQALEVMHTSPRQIIHGDLHPKNLMKYRGNIFFLDFDSAHTSPVEIDVAMAAFRLSGADRSRMHLFVETYNRSAPQPVEFQRVLQLLVFLILQRVLFILIERDRGIHLWLEDLENQQRYLDQAIILLSQADRSFRYF